MSDTAPPPTPPLRLDDCHASWSGGVLEVGNAAITRRWRIAGGVPLAASLRDERSKREWLVRERADAGADADAAGFTLAPDPRPAPPAQAPALRVVLASPDRRLHVAIFPGLAVVRTRHAQRADGSDAAGAAGTAAIGTSDGVEMEGVEPAARATDARARNVIERLPLAPAHLRLEAVELHGRTDERCEVVQPRRFGRLRGERKLALDGNLFALVEPFSGDGLVLLRHGLLPGSAPPGRRQRPDLLADAGTLELTEEPLQPDAEEGWRIGDWHAVVLHGGGVAGRVAALQHHEHRLRVPTAADRWMVSNTWGDRGRDGRVGEAFVLGEIEAAAELGVDVVQIDDGWQAGRSANSTEAGGKWSGFFESEGFWSPHPDRFPRGLTPLVDAARARGVRLGLWYAPDSSADFANWRRDAQTLLGLHRTLGVTHFKIDAVVIDSGLGESRFHRMIDRVLAGAGGDERITLDLDATAGKRPDFLGRPDAGPVFVQNRYTDWGSWFPHLTLRTLWQLARWVEPSRLRMEWLNPDRNPDRYADDALAPRGCSAAYAFASVMVAAPLAWMELQRLAPERRREAGPVIRAWREARADWVGATVVPVGDEPDGFGWTGFAVAPADPSRPRHLLAFRENHPASERTLGLPWDAIGPARLRLPAAAEALEPCGRELRLRLPRARSFGWWTLAPARA
ncbi:alpha-amylase family protein [Phycisphaera mikurensis]|uniref:Alpha-galactosidase n=1 Tax=Phycisphaera mikurensis (strain NBRC 102666 / KCTC 22515 / FYK2301M01) TaxID=1142394 RepID=I0ICY1_PHYMF|nr:alpha-galactosidase [Phycisphaera mikurensis]MBB6442249.1 alpha-galactosidase [Phycisphaera mikurensis]BAM03119.1 hypothetical protein PSMK_09600 [Phycisphaera mikurensis NBRC 102666]